MTIRTAAEREAAFTKAALAWMAAGHAYKNAIDANPSFGGPWPEVVAARDDLCEKARVMDEAYNAIPAPPPEGAKARCHLCEEDGLPVGECALPVSHGNVPRNQKPWQSPEGAKGRK